VPPLDALILGGGPAGCSCALWLQQLGHDVALVEREQRLGGLQATSPYPNTWIAGVMDRTGVEFARDLERQLRIVGVPLWTGSEPTRIARTPSGFAVALDRGAPGETVEAAHLVVATGVAPRTGGLEAAPGVLFGPGATLEAHDFTGQSVAILGGGDNAAENFAILAAKRPARLIMHARRLRARPPLLERVPEHARRVGPYQVDARARTVTAAGATERYDALVVLYGWEARIPAPVRALGTELIDARGFLAVDAERRTKLPGLWAIGEVAQVVHPCCVTAMSDGVICAKAIERERRTKQR
jgi:thioredoxin reductase